jgi:NAD(P)-dependent dehydrogenase (short-subunit alcohol dehydrogenase family)
MTGSPSTVALVVGASRGIGAATARRLAAEGALVVLAARDSAALTEVGRDIETAGGRAEVVRADITDADAVDALIAGVVDRHGRLDAAVNAAAAHGRRPTRLAETDLADFDDTIAVSLRGIYLCLRAEIRSMLASGRGGSIVNIASTAGLLAVGGLAAYVAAKHGVVGLTRSAALDYAGDGIRINALLPGSTHTEQLDRAGEAARARVAAAVPAGRLATPAEIADAAAWLCSAGSSYVTGSTLVVDGGLLAGQRPFGSAPPTTTDTERKNA